MTDKSLRDRLAHLSPEQRQALVEKIRESGKLGTGDVIQPQPDNGQKVLSVTQQRLWFLHQLDPQSPAYNMPLVLRLRGSLDYEVLRATLTEVLRRHETLRTAFQQVGDEATPVVAEEVELPWTFQDLSSVPSDERDGELQECISLEVARPFDLATGPPTRFGLFRVDDDDHVLAITIHHIVSDGWSLGILNHELSVLYEAFSKGLESPLPPLSLQYSDFAVWQRERLQGENLRHQVDYWRDQLEGSSGLELQPDRPRPPVQTFSGAATGVQVPPDLTEALREFSRAEGVTLAISLLAGFKAVLSRHTGQDDVIVGSPIANRNRSETEGMIGFFVNTLAMRTDLSGDPSFREAVRRVGEVSVGAYDHQDLPFDKVVEELQPPRDAGRTPFFQITFAVQNNPGGKVRFTDLEVDAYNFPIRTTRFDLEVHVFEGDGSLTVGFLYNTDLFDETTIQRLGTHYVMLLAGVVSDPDCPLSAIPLLGEEERAEMDSWASPSLPLPVHQTVTERFEEQVKRTPDQRAVVTGNGSLSYGELNEKANTLAHRLLAEGIGPEVPVAICVDRGPEMIIGSLAAWKAGGPFVPMDPKYPSDRLEYMLEDSGAAVVLTTEAFVDRIPTGVELPVIRINDPWEGPSTDPDPESDPSDAAYIIYTSGSTGRPKGVVVEHRHLGNFVSAYNHLVGMTDGDRSTQTASVSFDASVLEIWPVMIAGAELHIPSEEVLAEPSRLAEWMVESEISVSFTTTALGEFLIREAWPDPCPLRILLTGGDRLRAVPNTPLPFTFVNLYGPTENTVVATGCVIEPGTSVPPIGRPIANVYVRVLDQELRPVPIGVPGELYIGGASVTRGYHNRPELTATSFLPDPFAEDSEARLYASGDVVRWTSQGQLEFLGRRDSQTKIRGHRIELGEVESNLSVLEGVRDSVAMVRKDPSGDTRIVAYVVPSAVGTEEGQDSIRTSDPAFAATLREDLRRVLPDFMVPSAFVFIDSIPLTPHGKIDRKALPAPEPERQLEGPVVQARTEIEEMLVEVWREVLQVDQIGIHDNFFDLGGHSLKLLQVQRLITERMDTDLAVVELFEFPTVASLAKRLSGTGPSVEVLGEALERRDRRGSTDQNEPIAVVGMAGRFPGAPDVESLWKSLENGEELIRHFTPEEFAEAGIPEQVSQADGFVGSKGYLDDADRFDAAFFGYSPREAELIDPQQRLFLESAWTAIENAGHVPSRFRGLIGVFGGAGRNTYQANIDSRPDLAHLAGLQTVLGADRDFLTTRVSYKLGLRGPSVNVQTACSTSLVAVHMACVSLRSGECDMALAGGVSVGIPLVSGYFYQEDGIVSPDGHCRTFDAKAKGTVGGNGVGMVALRRISDAVADGDVIHAVIRGTAINNDGSEKVGFTAPGIDGQARVIAMALADSGVEPDSVEYVEAHGTATTLGDPIEMKALARAYGSRPEGSSPCGVGSLKSNAGHLDAAAGVASLIKAVLCLRHGKMVPSLHFSEPNPEIDFLDGAFYVTTENRPWPRPAGHPRRAAVSSFGLGGTNAHVVLEEGPEPADTQPESGLQLLRLSARTPERLAESSLALADHLERNPNLNLGDVAHTLREGRESFRARRVVLASTLDEAVSGLRNDGGGRTWSGSARADGAKVAFLFPGQGAQYQNMGRGLYESEPVFRSIIDECAETLGDTLGKDLRQILYPEDPEEIQDSVLTSRTLVTQSTLFAVELALAHQWRAWGIEPVACIGHSIGEYVAACFGGGLSIEAALGLVRSRGLLMEEAPAGSMIAIPLSEKAIEGRLGEGTWLSVINGPEACVVAGVPDRVEALEEELRADGIECRKLHTAGAFHSGLMDGVLEPLTQYAQEVEVETPSIPWVSNVTGNWIESQDLDPSYWARHVRQPVRFNDGLTRLFESGVDVLLEVGPGNTLGTLARRRLRADSRSDVTVLTSLRHARQEASDPETIGEAAGRLWTEGIDPSLPSSTEVAPSRITLPTYPFARDRYWVEPGTGGFLPGRLPIEGRGEIHDWFHVPVWSQVPPGSGGQPDSTEPWLFLEDARGLGDWAASALADRGIDLLRVSQGPEFKKVADRRYEADQTSPEGFKALLTALAGEGLEPRRFLHTGCLAEDASDTDSYERGIFSLLHLFQSLPTPETDPIGVTILTNRLFSVAGEPTWVPERGGVRALARVAAQNLPGLRFSVLDVDEPPTPRAKAHVVQLIAEPRGEIVSVRKGRPFVRTFDPLALPEPARDSVTIKEGGSYLITGGLGNVGLSFASFLAAEYRAKLTLLSRSGLPDPENDQSHSAVGAIKHLQEAGSEVLVVPADVGDPEALRAAMEAAEVRFGGIDGIIHAAGLTGGATFKPLLALERDDFEAQSNPKWRGTKALRDALGSRTPDFCLLVSSLSVELGGFQFGAYAAANAAMDHVADEFDRDSPIRWIAADLDGWDFQGAIQSGTQDFGFTPEEGVEATRRILASPAVSSVVVCTGDFPVRLAQSMPEVPDANQPSTTYDRPDLDTEYAEPRDETEEIVAVAWADALGLDRVGIHDDFFELGGDSLMAIQLMGGLSSTFQVELGVQALFEAPTVAQLAEKTRVAKESAAEESERLAQLADRISQMSDEEVQAALESGDFEFGDDE